MGNVPYLRAHPTATRRAALGAILLLAFVLRVWNLNWDQGTHQHPDERYWSIITDEISAAGPIEYFDSASSSMNPYNLEGRDTWVYGTFPLFTTKAAASFLADGPFPAGAVVTTADAFGIDLRTDGVDDFDAGYNANLVGRLLSALIDTATVGMVYLLGRDLFDRRVGFVAAGLLALTPLHIQYAHFYGAEPWVAFFVTAAIWMSLRIGRGDVGFPVTVSTGLLIGLAAASKLIGLAALVVPATALAVAVAPAVPAAVRQRKRAAWESIGLAALAGLVVVGVTALTYRIFQPYSFDGLVSIDPRFSRDIDYLESVNSGGNVPWVVQWIGRPPLLFPLQSAFLWGMGPALALAVVAGTAQAVIDVARRHRWILLLPIAFLAVMLGLVSQQFNPLIRYLQPAYPTAIVLGAFGVVTLWKVGTDLVARRRSVPGRVLQVLAVGAVAGTAFWGLAFVNGVYNTEHPRVQASIWMADNLPPDATISAQIWDDALPLGVPGTEGTAFTLVELDPFQPDVAVDQVSGRTKVEQFLDGLDQVDYIVEASNRVYDSVARFPARYPSTAAYYEALFDGTLGFEQVARFRSSPSLFGIDLPDHDAEETFTVYDHPTVTIWAKTDAFSLSEATRLLNPAKATRAPDVPPSDAATNALLLEPDDAAAVTDGPTFSEAFEPEGPTGTLPWLWWLAWLQVASLAALPWTTLMFGRLPDRGIGLAKVTGFLAVGLGAWLTVAWDVADYGRGLALAWFLIVAGVGVLLWWRHHERMTTLWHEQRRQWITAELVFVGVFALALLMRSANPDLWERFLGGEKPMEVAYLTSIARASDLPAPDPWFGGGFMNYYYLGWFFLTVPMRALRVAPEIGFNLGVATYAALTAVSAFSVVHNLVGFSRDRWIPAKRARADSGAIAAGLLGVVLLIGIGNLDAIRLHYDRLAAVNTWETGTSLPLIGRVITFAGGTWAWITGTPLDRFDFFAPSRVNDGNIDITEFPYFTFLFGDLHPHLMGMVFIATTISVAMVHLVASRSGRTGLAVGSAAGLGLMTGVVRTVNTWDVPSVVLVTAGAILVGRVLEPTPEASESRSWRGASAVIAVAGLAAGLSVAGGPGGAVLAVVGAAGLLALGALVAPFWFRRRALMFLGYASVAAVTHLAVFWPFLTSNETFETGLRSAADQSPLGDFLVHWGIFLFFAAALVVALVVDGRRRTARGDPTPAPLPPRLWSDVRWRGASIGVAVAAVVLGGVLATGVVALSVAGVIVFAAFGVSELRRPEPDLGRITALGLFALGFGIAGGVDVVTVENDIERMNTVFKFWLQAWQYFALASAFAAWQVTRIVAERSRSAELVDRDTGHQLTYLRSSSGATRAWLGLVGIVVLAGLAYPLLGTRTRLETRFAALPASLDGLDYLDAQPTLLRTVNGTEQLIPIGHDLPLIEWYRANVEGTPTQLEWSGQLYDWTSRMAIYTGLPTVVGWDWHQKQQRWDYQWMVDRRVDDVRRFYTLADHDEMTTILRAYEVAYVTVGTQEVAYGSADALARIDNHPALRPVFRTGDYAIYEVDEAALWS